MNNIVIRECNKCGFYEDDTKAFTYLHDGVWSCSVCNSKYTHIREVIDPDNSHNQSVLPALDPPELSRE